MEKLKKINIGSFGSFVGFDHTKYVHNDYEHINIFYGENYSGKTTLSKVFQSFELNKLPENYSEIKFDLITDSKTFTEADVNANNGEQIKCKVFNAEFQREKLNFHKENGINAFELSIGADNLKINELIKAKREEESQENIKNSLLTKQRDEFEKNIKISQRKIDSIASKKASEIKRMSNPQISLTTYNMNDFKLEIEKAKSFSKLNENDINRYRKIIIEDEKSKQPHKIFPKYNFQNISDDANKLIQKKISIESTIEEFINSPKKGQWLKEGLALHKHEGVTESNCIFCGNFISDSRYKLLDEIFTTEISDFENELKEFHTKLKSIEAIILHIKKIDASDFYVNFGNEISSLNKEIEILKNKQLTFIRNIINILEKKMQSLFIEFSIEIDLIPEDFEEIRNIYNDLVDSHNLYTIELIDNKDKSKEKLRLNYLLNVFEATKFEELERDLYLNQNNLDNTLESLRPIQKKLVELQEQISTAERSISDEKQAAIKINEYLGKFSIDENIQLGVEPDSIRRISTEKNEETDIQTSFYVMRNGKRAFNLSEGEMNLISFSYFLATLNMLSDENKAETIIFIDDPISSLDQNNIFYIYSLIFKEIIQDSYLQVFISTHNLDFLKYMTKYKKNRSQINYYILRRTLKSSDIFNSKIEMMPKYIKQRVTEFNFLFAQIYEVATTKHITDENYHVFYNFPNNARKYLETLLYFKYPNYKKATKDSYIDYFGDEIYEYFINRINNEFSHGEGQFDRLSNIINTTEFTQEAKIILQKVYDNDSKQFAEFLDNSSLNMPDFLKIL